VIPNFEDPEKLKKVLVAVDEAEVSP